MMRKAPLIRRSELRSRKRMKPSMGTVIPPAIRNYVLARDNGCVGRLLRFPGECAGPLDPDHVRPSGGVGMKSPTEPWNLASLCRYVHHPWKTEHPKEARPLLVAYLEQVEARSMPGDVW